MVQFYQYGTIDPSRCLATEPPKEAQPEPTVYQYIPAVQAAEPPPPAPPANPALAQPAIQFGMTQQIYGMLPFPGQQNAQVQLVPQAQPQVHAYHAPAPMAPVAPPPPAAYQGAVPWRGATRAEVNAQNMVIANAVGANRPTTLIPYKMTHDQSWWVRELDGSYTVRTTNDIMENLQPGKWDIGPAGYAYFIRHAPPA